MRTPASAASANLECVCDYAASTGESPAWSIAEQALYWIDIQEPALHRFDPASGEDRRWSVPDEIGCFALHATGERAILGLRSGVYQLRLKTGALDRLAAAPFDPDLFRFNEGGCDCTGRFWLGTMFDPKDRNLKSARLESPWHSYSGREGLVPHRDLAVVPNGLGWDSAFRTLYVSHSHKRTIYAYDFDAEAGHLGARRVFATIPRELGIPDGCAIDADGGYWTALNGGGRLRRFSATGEFDHDVHLPVSLPTMCAFGGAALDTLYVTSKSLGLTPKQRSLEPLAGKLLRFRPGFRGKPTADFGG